MKWGEATDTVQGAPNASGQPADRLGRAVALATEVIAERYCGQSQWKPDALLLDVLARWCDDIQRRRTTRLSQYPGSMHHLLLEIMIRHEDAGLSANQQQLVLQWCNQEDCQQALLQLPLPWWSEMDDESVRTSFCCKHRPQQPECLHVAARIRQIRSTPAVQLDGSTLPPQQHFVVDRTVFETTHRPGALWSPEEHWSVWEWLGSYCVTRWLLIRAAQYGLDRDDAEDAVQVSFMRFGFPACYGRFVAARVAFPTWYANGPLRNAVRAVQDKGQRRTEHESEWEAVADDRRGHERPAQDDTDPDNNPWIQYHLFIHDCVRALKNKDFVLSKEERRLIALHEDDSMAATDLRPEFLYAVVDGLVWIIAERKHSNSHANRRQADAEQLSSAEMLETLVCVLLSLEDNDRCFLYRIGMLVRLGRESSEDMAEALDMRADAMRKRKERLRNKICELVQSCCNKSKETE
jgi:hypothetical protein